MVTITTVEIGINTRSQRTFKVMENDLYILLGDDYGIHVSVQIHPTACEVLLLLAVCAEYTKTKHPKSHGPNTAEKLTNKRREQEN